MAQEADGDSSHSISSYFNEYTLYEEDPFRLITPPHCPDSIVSNEGPVKSDIGLSKLNIPERAEAYTVLDSGISPPITEENMHSEDLILVKEATNPDTQDQLTTDEIDRIHDAWIPSDHIRQALLSKLGAGSRFQLPPDKATRPSIMMHDTQPDPVTEVMYKLRGEAELHKRRTMDASKVTHNLLGLATLIKAECWRSALDLTGILLTAAGQGDRGVETSGQVLNQQTIRIWACRIALLTKLKLFSIAEAECQAFGYLEAADLYHQFHNPQRSGTMVPFSLRLLHCFLPQFLGRSNETLDRLFHVKGQISKILHNLQNGLAEDGSADIISEASRDASLQLWHQRELQILYKIASCFLNQKCYSLAIKTYEEILRRDPDNDVFTCSTLGRIFLYIGIKRGYEKYFRMSEEACADDCLKERQISLHRGYMALAQGDYRTVPSAFLKSTNIPASYTVSKNNAAVCMLYSGQLKSGLLLLEELIESNPTKFLQDTLLTNITTLYELESCDVNMKKQELILLANEYKGNGFNISAIKINT